MKLNKINAAVLAGLTSYTLSIPVMGVANAQETEAQDNVEKIAVVGARGAPRSVTSSPVPVDVISEDEINSVSFSDMNDVMMTLVPSYSVSRQPISDGASFIRPASLRGLPTDKTLVLVNGKRRHRSALVATSGSGTQGPDLATIPTAAIKGLEVLRDGAAAQYGSDAIAGVINFNLKDNDEGGSFSAELGQYFEGDGGSITISGNKGFSLGDNGFLSISAEYVNQERTDRAEQYCESWFCVPDQSEDYQEAQKAMSNKYFDSDNANPWGQPESEAARLFFNAGYTVNSNLDLYAFGNYSWSDSTTNFFYRYPGNGTIEDIRLEDGSIWSPTDIFPGGFTPVFSGEVTDYSIVLGGKGILDSGLGYDLSARYGYDEIAYTLENTINPSLGDATPTKFSPGSLSNEEFQIQGDFFYDIDQYVLAFGFSYMDETYDLIPGDAASYEAGIYSASDPWGFCDSSGGTTTAGLDVIASGSSLDCADEDDPVYQIMGVGSNGFPGYDPEYSGDYSRDSYAVYGDLSGDLTDNLFGQASIRFEDYSDFGSELVYKLAAMYQITDEFGVRGSFGTGFRAPTPGQQGTTNVSTTLPDGFPVAQGLFPASSEVAQALGAEDLKAEKSTNSTLGITYTSGNFSATLDYYNIKIEDRLYSISELDISSDEDGDEEAYDNYLKLLAATDQTTADSIGAVIYFQNAFDTVTEGVDFVTAYNLKSEYGNTRFTLSLNYNTTEFDSDPSDYLNAEAMYDFEHSTPKTRGVFSVVHSLDDYQLTARVRYFGEYENIDSVETATDGSIIWEETGTQTFGQEFMFDLEGTYHISSDLSLVVGVRNLFDNYPDEVNDATSGDACCGRVYSSGSVVDWQGGYYYTKFVARF
ncbi:TonB-dependent receptor [Alteromonas sp. C1M14]|uniref:TonB-dependent receptor plug domain-containing protein n=1 Tax=Alteromonas sp. C1M14 TaxID=2841567 RepID=UPI001C09684E|nr:TonB-dependent receptor [Alteromonas sp. C1M14]MBU2978192.1 TonB-dependent receptor [Alteromonas sp. C1M14]